MVMPAAGVSVRMSMLVCVLMENIVNMLFAARLFFCLLVMSIFSAENGLMRLLVCIFMLVAVLVSFVANMLFAANLPGVAAMFVFDAGIVLVYVRIIVCMSMMVSVLFRALFFAVDQNFHARAFYAAFDAGEGAVFYAGDSERVETPDEFFRFRQEFQQRRREHVAGGAHSAVYV